MLFLAHIDNDVFIARALAYDFALVDRYAGAYEQPAALLRVE